MIKTLEDFKAYNLAMETGEQVWEIVKDWSFFEKDTVGKQLVRAVDSIGNNPSMPNPPMPLCPIPKTPEKS